MSLPTNFFIGRGGAIAPQPITSFSDGALILNGYGFELYKAGVGNANKFLYNFTVPSGVKKLRFIAIGAGAGGTDTYNVYGAGGGGGIEGFLDVSAGETIRCQVGIGGEGVDTGNSGRGGDSDIYQASTGYFIEGLGGYRNQDGNNLRRGSQYSGGYPSSNVISEGTGGATNADGDSSSNLNPIANSVYLSGATAHAGGAGGWNSHPVSFGAGLGFGGGGGFTNSTSARRSGGIYGYAGGNGQSSTGNAGLGPVGGNPYGPTATGSGSGGGGGSYGGGGCDGWSGGCGAGGLIRIWWASSQGDPNWILSGGNYV